MINFFSRLMLVVILGLGFMAGVVLNLAAMLFPSSVLAFEGQSHAEWRGDMYPLTTKEVMENNQFALNVQPPVWSPDGHQIAFTSIHEGNSDIYVMEMASASWRNVTAHQSSDYQPNWSPDGQQLAFASDRNGSIDIFVLNGSDGELNQLMSTYIDESNPVWQP